MSISVDASAEAGYRVTCEGLCALEEIDFVSFETVTECAVAFCDKPDGYARASEAHGVIYRHAL